MRQIVVFAALMSALSPVVTPKHHVAPPKCESAAMLDSISSAITRAVNLGTYDALAGLVDSRWNSVRLGSRRGSLLGTLQGWHWRSNHLDVVATCRATPSAGYSLLRNGLTHEIDSLWFDLDTLSGQVRNLQVPQGGRVELSARDTASDSARVQALDALMRRLVGGGVFSGEVLFAHNGRILYHEALGIVDRDARRAARLDEPYSIASVGKMFTSAAIMKLVASGRMTLDDTLGAFLPIDARPRGAGGVALKYLLTHTSGVQRDVDTLLSAPGTRFRYDNYSYFLLGKVIESVTHQSFDEYFRTALFEPLGMNHTFRLVRDTPDPTLAPAYDVKTDSNGVHFVVNPQAQTIAATGAGGMFSTATDLFRFADALRSFRILPRQTVQAMRRIPTEWGSADYGSGIDRMRGGSIWGHTGYLPGANADVEIYGDSGYLLVVLANMPANEPVRRLVSALVGNQPMV